MRVAAIQHDIVWEDRDANLERLAPMVARAAGAGGQLVVLAEMFAVGFSMNTEKTSEPEDGPTSQWLVEQARQHDIWIGGSIPEQLDHLDRPFNSFVIAGPDGTRHRYHKIHPFTYAGEHEHFAAGDEHVLIEIDGVRITPFVCYDLRFADEFWNTGLRTDCFVIPANWPRGRRQHWYTLLRARAIENQCYVVGVNRVGSGGDLDYSGNTQIIDPMGKILASASTDEAIVVTDVDPNRVRETRERFPFHLDRS